MNYYFLFRQKIRNSSMPEFLCFKKEVYKLEIRKKFEMRKCSMEKYQMFYFQTKNTGNSLILL